MDTKDKKIEELEQRIVELEIQLNPIYCEKCGACGEDGCCPSIQCEKIQCLYGEDYVKDYEFDRKCLDLYYSTISKVGELIKQRKDIGELSDDLKIINDILEHNTQSWNEIYDSIFVVK